MHKRLQKAIDLHIENKIEEAKELYSSLLSLLEDKELNIALINLGNIYFLEKESRLARAYYKRAKELDSKNEKIYFNIAMTYLFEERLLLAKEYFLIAIERKYDYLSAYINIAVLYKKLGDYDSSIEYFELALDIDKNEPDIYYNYANVLFKKEQYHVALNFLDRALELGSKDEYKIFYTKGVIYQNKGRYKEALENFNNSLRLNSNYADAHFAKATILLLLGDFRDGWREYSYRWDAKNELKRPNYSVRWYKGESLKNKRVLVQQEQGFGDNIQFVRYVSKLVEFGAEVFLALKKELHILFSSIEGVKIIGDKDSVDRVDFFTSLLDLPNILYNYQNEFLYKESYLKIKKSNSFEVRVKDRLNIGFAWRGNIEHKGDKKRSIPLKYFEPLFCNKFAYFYSLQYENSEELIEFTEKYSNIHNCKDYIKDFNDTANIVSKLDFVITIDSSLAHLCGAIGVEAWLLLNKYPEWRWLLDRDDSIWYKSLRLFRQKEHEKSWDRLFLRVNKEIEEEYNKRIKCRK